MEKNIFILQKKLSNPDLMRWVNELKRSLSSTKTLKTLKSRPHEMGQWTEKTEVLLRPGKNSQIPTSWDGSMNLLKKEHWKKCWKTLKSRPHEMGQWTKIGKYGGRDFLSLSNPDLMRWVNELFVAWRTEFDSLISQIPTSWDGSMNFKNWRKQFLDNFLSNPDLMRWVNELEKMMAVPADEVISQIPTSWDGSMNRA